MDKEFKYELGAQVRLSLSAEEAGFVIGRAEYQESDNYYLVRYKAGNGCQVEAWWSEAAIKRVL